MYSSGLLVSREIKDYYMSFINVVLFKITIIGDLKITVIKDYNDLL